MAPKTPKERGKRRWKIVGMFVLALLLILTVGALTYRHVTRPERVRALAESYLQQYLQGRVSVGNASFSWQHGIRLFDVHVSEVGDPSADTRSHDVFFCPEIRLTHDAPAMLWGKMKIQSVVAVDPTCIIARDQVTGRTNIEDLLVARNVPETGAEAWPRVELEDARVQVVSREPGGDRLVQDLKLNVRALPASHASHVYDIVWTEKGGRVASGHSQIDLRTGALHNVRDGLPWMSIEAVMLVINARYDGVGAWSDLLGLDGTVRARDYQLPADGEARSATVELSDAALSIPISDEERPLSPNERYLSFQSVRGHVQLTGGEIHADFSGTLHGSPCDVSMTLGAGQENLTTLDDVHVDARLSIQDLVLPRSDATEAPAEARFVHRWRRLAEVYREFSPRGTVDIDVAVSKKAGKDEPLHVRRMNLTAKHGSGEFRHFPYRLNDLEGQFVLSPEEFVVRDLKGRHGDTAVHIDAWMRKPTRGDAKKVTIRATDLAVDQDLYNAIPVRFRRLWDQFDPSGVVDVNVDLEQPAITPDMPMHWLATHDITVKKAKATFAGFPYPVEDLSGTLVITPDRFEVRGLKGRHGAAQVGIDGVATIVDKKMDDLNLAIHATKVPFDDTLLQALPLDSRNWVQQAHPTGTFDVDTVVRVEPETHRIVHSSNASLNAITVTHDAFPAHLTDVLGNIRIDPHRIQVQGLTGKFGDATASVDGSVDVTKEIPAYDFNIRTRNLRLDRKLRELLPPNDRKTLADWTVDGPVSSESRVFADANMGGAPRVASTIHLDDVAVQHRIMPQPLQHAHATVVVDTGGIHIERFDGTYGTASVNGSVNMQEEADGRHGAVQLTATDLPLDNSTRALFPEAVQTVWDRVGPSGLIDLHVDALNRRNADDTGPGTWSVEGKANLKGVNLAGVADVQNASGSITVRGMLADRLEGTVLRGDMKLNAVNVLGQPVTDSRAMWSFVHAASGEGMFDIDQIDGSIHEGKIDGRVGVTMHEGQSAYGLSLRIEQMRLGPFVDSERTSRSNGKEPTDVRGKVDASLHLSGTLDKPGSMRGGGRIDVREGDIFRTPLMLSIVHVLNLTLPTDYAIENIKVDFLVAGRLVHAEQIELDGSLLAMLGSGTMSLPDCGLDLRLVHVNPKNRARIPLLTDVIEGASRELVELQVTGPLSQPTVRTVPLGGLAEELKKLIQRRKPKPPESVQPRGS